VLALGGALLVLAVGVDLVLSPEGGVAGPARFLHLLSYRYDRVWPSELDFQPAILAFALAAGALCLAFGIARWRRRVIIAHALMALVFAGWLGQHYLVSVAPYFGQRHVIEAFYRDRSSPAEPLIAYQLNWKGENFYTGNHLAIFVKSGARMRRHVRERRAAGERVLHFVLEPSRLSRLRAELGRVERFSLLTEPRVADKFCLVRVELL
jgi:hypothetical protein